MTKKRIVIDTTVLISAALWPTGYPRDAVFSALNDHTVLLSTATYQEIAETLFRSKFNRYQSVESRQRFLFLYQFAASNSRSKINCKKIGM